MPRDDDHTKITLILALLDDEASPLGRVDRERWPALAPATMKGVCHVLMIAEVPLCPDLFLYDIVRVRAVPHGDMEKVSTCLQRYYASQHAIYYLPDMQMGNQPLVMRAGRACARR